MDLLPLASLAGRKTQIHIFLWYFSLIREILGFNNNERLFWISIIVPCVFCCLGLPQFGVQALIFPLFSLNYSPFLTQRRFNSSGKSLSGIPGGKLKGYKAFDFTKYLFIKLYKNCELCFVCVCGVASFNVFNRQ